MYRLHDTTWKFWFFSLLLLAGGMLLVDALVWWAVLLALYQVQFFWQGRGSASHMDVQVRVGYLLALLLGLAPELQWLHWLLLGNTTLLLVSDDCLLERGLGMLPWNRRKSGEIATLNDSLLQCKQLESSGMFL